MTAISREHIIAEIQRTAAANGGTPLGRARFQEATGIRETDWSGRYWARWSDAVGEAGYGPNQMQQALDPDTILAALASLTQDMGRLPSVADLKMRRRQDASFPSHNTFNRLGDRAHRARALLDYCEVRSDLSAVADICRPIAAVDEQAPDSWAHAGAADAFGFVYLMKSGKFYKIGLSICPEKRAYEVRLVLPEEVVLVHKIKTDDPAGIEAYWHHRFKDRRLRGEWFDLSAQDIKAFRRRSFM